MWEMKFHEQSLPEMKFHDKRVRLCKQTESCHAVFQNLHGRFEILLYARIDQNYFITYMQQTPARFETTI
jgi:hypothetical protein